ncbi:uncharacterized protein ASPGLDRAFT_85095 [Aspergillus glaucus CBS 516.65]|uniref:Uncharacterized protein n=1 Tax=Aspergillus glaucus CBS 516.65 TaxID=1160497 RepID=A0A1L9V9M8_ASPGL|nr:hypothetical protein ASPGLDRAFT_85095 [Aspergillus glaucus CBS 516.65]OJJ80628.1 hypothetical protein ASPGLDRAFT_85095 [Aspergillus glaucus CBS 516.65]
MDQNTHKPEDSKKLDRSVEDFFNALGALYGDDNAGDDVRKRVFNLIDFLSLGCRKSIFEITQNASLRDVTKAAGRGNAVTNAHLCITGKGKNTEAYVALYGLEPEKVLEFRKYHVYYAIEALNYHAWLIAENEKEDDISVDVKGKHQRFLQELERTEHFSVSPKTEHESPLMKLYYAYMKAAGHDSDRCFRADF